MKKVWIGLAILSGMACVVLGVMVARRPAVRPGMGGPVPDGPSFEERMAELEGFDPKLLIGKETARYPTGLKEMRGIGVGPDDALCAVGDKALVLLGKEGAQQDRIELGAPPLCVAVGADSAIYVGFRDHVEVFDARGKKTAAWPNIGPLGWIVSIAVSETDVYVADFGEKYLLRFDLKGALVARYGTEGKDKGRFELPSPNFDVALDSSGSPWVVQTGKHLIMNLRDDGSLVTQWGKYSPRVDGFSGCCNPCHIAIRRDGTFVTSEKGTVRVKIHKPNGDLVGVIAQAKDFKRDVHGLDLAVDSKDRVLVLDPDAGAIRAFTVKIPVPGE
jgi:hypothetical protein